MDIKLTDREAELMEILWHQGASTVAEAREGFDDDLAYTTVLTMMRILEQKGPRWMVWDPTTQGPSYVDGEALKRE